MKIGIDARMYGAQATTGIGFYIQQLIEQLAVVDKKNQYYLFMRPLRRASEASQTARDQFNPPNNRFRVISADIPWYSYQEQIKLPNLLNRQRLDLVHFPHFNVPMGYRRPYIVTIHDITPTFFPGPNVKKSVWRKQAYRLVFTQGLRRARQIIAISQHTKQQLVDHYRVNPDRIEVIYPGVNQQCQPITNQTTLEAVRQRHGITKPFLFYVGVWRDHKNLPGLVEAFTQLKSKYQLDLQLVLGGTPDPRYPEIRSAIEHCPFKNDILTPGFIDDEDLPALYSAAKLFVLPSFAEGFGLVTVEAAACGTPVVGSSTTSLPEVLGNVGRYFDPNSPDEMATVINRVLTDTTEYELMKAEGLAIVDRYQWQTCAKKTLELYNTIEKKATAVHSGGL